MENYKDYRQKIKETYANLKGIDPEMAKSYIEQSQDKLEYQEARDAKIENREKITPDPRENIEELKLELSYAIQQYDQNGMLEYVQRFTRDHGPQEYIVLDSQSKKILTQRLSGSIRTLLRDPNSTLGQPMVALSLFKDAGVFDMNTFEEILPEAFASLKIRDRAHGENSMKDIDQKVEIVRKQIGELFTS